ncbi:MAG: DegT/DnrJ/EryC1/StrS family aminotransferase [Acidimicrobiales bacterium]
MKVPSASAVATDDDIESVVSVLRSGSLANGPEAAALEVEFARAVGAKHAVAVSSGTDALYVAGRAIGVGGRVVLAAGFSFAATANAFLSLGAVVVPVDVDPVTMNISADALAKALEEYPETAVVVVVDLFGSTSGTDEALRIAGDAGVIVIEDGCQAHGAVGPEGKSVGARADFTAFSLYATKNVSAGEGGIVTTEDDDRARLLRLLRNHGSASQYVPEIVGLNHRLPEMSAALGRSRLARLHEGNRLRREHAEDLASWCSAAWPGVSVPLVPVDMLHVFHQFTVVFAEQAQRDLAHEALRNLGIDARIFYPYTLAELPEVVRTALPVAESLRDRVLSLPVHAGLSADQLEILHESIVTVGEEPWWA